MIQEIKLTDKYNIIKLVRKETIEYYIEKIGYGDLKFVFGCNRDIDQINEDYFLNYVKLAEEGFWE